MRRGATGGWRRSSPLGVALLATAAVGCGAGGGGSDEAALRQLAPAQLPAPPRDVSNRFADDPRAARFGQRLFFDAAFSGRLLDGDNDGAPGSLGMKGETGKVSCAGCHVPRAGFLDDRTLNKQISLAAGWGRRRAPSLLDVGQARLVTWDGRRDALYGQPFGVIESVVEMNSSRLFAAEQIARRHRAEYEAIFGPLPPLEDPARFPQLTADTTGCPDARGAIADPCPTARPGLPGDRA